MYRKRKITLAVFCLFLFNQIPAYSTANPKLGASCKTINQIKKFKSQTFICTKQGKKFIWSIHTSAKKILEPEKKVEEPKIPQQSATTTPAVETTNPGKKIFSGPCDYELDVDPYWSSLRDFYQNQNWCLGPLKTVPIFLTNEIPKTSETKSSDLLEPSRCQIKEQDSVANGRAFPSIRNQSNRASSLHPGPKTVFQIIPIYSDDAPLSGKTPREDYKGYIDFIESYIKYSSDGESSVEFRVPNEYIYFPKKLSNYDMRHENNWNNPVHLALGREILSAVDAKINFSGVNLSIVVAPAGTSHDVIEQSVLNRFGEYQTILDGQAINFMAVATPATFSSAPERHQNFTSPMWWFHELHHVGIGLADHNGDNFYQNNRGENTNSPGMGNWGIMSMSKTELTTWEKWMLGYITDGQVRCATSDALSIHWITPSSYKSKKTKLLVIHLSESKVIVVESIRAGGLNYKLGKESEGALVYVVDTSEPGLEYGMQVLRPESKPVNLLPFVLSDATLKFGEKIKYQGIEIKVVESGEYGDVVMISKAN